MDGFTVISSCFFALTLAVTFALIIQINFGPPQVTPHGAVATDDQQCSEIGVNIIKEGGNGIDAVIASLICLSVTHPYIVGPGGGGVLLLHDHKKNESKVYDFMTSIPRLFENSSRKSIAAGWQNIGVPGFIKGIEDIHKWHGSLSWKKLFEPSIALARNGFPISRQLADTLSKPEVASFSQQFKATFFPKGIAPVTGSVIKRNKFADFLDDVSIGGSKEFYFHKYGFEVIKALKSVGSSVSVQDFQHYEVTELPILKETLNNKTVLTVGYPFGGLQIISALKALDKLGVDETSSLNSLYEGFVHGLLKAATMSNESAIGNATSTSESNFPDQLQTVPEFPSAQISVIDTHDLYVTAVAGLGSSFGSGIMTEHEIFLNDHLQMPSILGDSSDEGSNFEPRRPLTSYSPLIFLDSKNVCGKRVVLSSGSSSAMFQVVGQLIFRNMDMTPAIIEPRILLGREPHQLLIYDFDKEGKLLPTAVRQHLQSKHFIIKGQFEPLSVNGVIKVGDIVLSHSDTRGGGIAARVDAHLQD